VPFKFAGKYKFVTYWLHGEVSLVRIGLVPSLDSSGSWRHFLYLGVFARRVRCCWQYTLSRAELSNARSPANDPSSQPLVSASENANKWISERKRRLTQPVAHRPGVRVQKREPWKILHIAVRVDQKKRAMRIILSNIRMSAICMAEPCISVPRKAFG
jgi:hypothetical protein